MHIPRPNSSASGLSMLLGNSPKESTGARLLQIPVDAIERNEAQPRTRFEASAIAALAESIAASGVIQPIAVRELSPGHFEIVAGERRWLASQQAGLATIPAVVHEVDQRDSLVLALAENLVREDLNPLETARAYAALIDEFGMTAAELASTLGRSRPAVANTLRLLELPDEVLAAIEDGRLSEGHGRAVLQLPDRAAQTRLARRAIVEGWSVRTLEAQARAEADGQPSAKDGAARFRTWNQEPSAELQAQLDRVADRLPGVRARVKLGERGAKLELQARDAQAVFALIDQLDELLAQPA